MAYPGQSHHHHHQHHEHHHHHPGGFGPPPGGPPGGTPGFPSAPGYPSPGYGNGPGGYAPAYAPPPGGPGYGGGFAPPSGPPTSTYPGGPGGYGPPSGPPPGASTPYAPPPGGPPSQWGAPRDGYGGGGNGYGGGDGYGGGYAPPSGPPPMPPSQQQYYGPQFQGADNSQQQVFFQYSQCNGKKKALCIGINYINKSAELKGCINDAENVKAFLCGQFGYREDDIVMLTDDARNPRQVPTKENIIQAMHWLVRDAQPNDSLFFHYSGHGGQTKDLDGDEDDGYDEVIYPVDFETNGHIVDDDLHAIMVRPLPPGCRLTAIFDSCHSGSALDLPYIYSHEGKVKEPNLAAEAGKGLLSAVGAYARGDTSGMFKSAMGVFKAATGNQQKAQAYAKQTRTSPADAISWSGCKDSQTSADTVEAGRATGAMSYAFITALRENPQQSYQQLLLSLRAILKGKYSQKPQLSASHPMDTNIMFIA